MRRNAIIASTLAALVLISGCLVDETNEPAAVPQESAEAESGAYGPGEHLAWNATLGGSVGIRFLLTPAQETTCVVDFAYDDIAAPAGWDAFMTREDAQDLTWVLYGNHLHDVQVRAGGLVDSRPIVKPERYKPIIHIEWTAEGIVEPTVFTMAATGLSKPAGEEGSPNVWLDVSCKADFTVSQLEGGREFIIFDAWKTDGGVGAGVSPLGFGANAAAADGFVTTFDAPVVQVYVAESYATAGVLDLTHPGGTERMLFQPRLTDDPEFHELVGGPGTYEVDLTEVGVFGSGFWGIMLGLTPIGTLDEIEELPSGHAHMCPGLCA